MASLPRPDNRLYFGRGGSGKTTLALQHAEKFPRVLFVRPDELETPPYPATRDRAELIRSMMQPRFRVAFVTDRDVDLWEWTSEAAMKAGECVVIWEEAESLMDGPKLPPWANSLWMAGRHPRCRVFATSKRPARISRDCTANVSRAIIFNTTEPGDLKFFRDMIGDAGAIDAIRALKAEAFEAVDWTQQGYVVKRAPFQ